MRSIQDIVTLGAALVVPGVAIVGCGGDDSSTAPPTASIQLLAPVGGEIWNGVRTIQWQSQNAISETVQILLSSNSGGSYPLTIAMGLSSSASYSWDVSGVDDGSTYRIRVNLVDASQAVVASDASGADFVIDNPGSIELLAPVGDESWDGVRTIQWQTRNAGSETVSILLSSNSGASYPVTVAAGLAHDAPYDWDVSGLEDGSTYRVRVDLLDASQTVVDSDASAADFTIDNPEPRLLIADIPFADANLAAVMVGTGLTYADEVTSVQAREKDIADLSGIEYLVNLVELNVFGNSLVDLSPLAGLANLAELDVGGNQIVDLSPMANLATLTELSVDRNPSLTDLSPVADLTALTWLDASLIDIESLTPLAGLTALEHLNLQMTGISDISDLATLTSLRRLLIPNNEITSLAVVAGMTQLTDLAAFANQITDLTPLAGLTQLEVLRLSGNPISDFSALSNLVNLQVLNVAGTGFNNFSLLSGMTMLEELFIYGNELTDATPLAQFTSLRLLQANGNSFTDLSPLSALTNLTDLYFEGSDVQDVSSLATLTTLRYVDARNNEITTGVAALVTLVNATTINLEGNDTIPCADLDTLEAALGEGVVKRPASCA
jgi:internalin A